MERLANRNLRTRALMHGASYKSDGARAPTYIGRTITDLACLRM